MSFELETAEDLAPVGNYLSASGIYHLVITEMRDGAGSKGTAIEGFSIDCDVLAGNVAGQEGKKIDLTFWKPKLNDKPEQQERTKKANTAFAIASNLIRPDQLGKPVTIDLEAAVGAQVIAQLVPQRVKGEDGEYHDSDRFLQLHFSNIYHVDDPEVAAIPKNADALEMIDKAHRHPAEFFAFKAKKTAPAKPAEVATAADSSKWDDL